MSVEVILSRRGRKTEYHDGIPEQMLGDFQESPQTVTAPVLVVMEEGAGRGRSQRQEVRTICAEMPTFERFGLSLGVTYSTLRAWAGKYPEMGEAWEMCKMVQKDFLLQGLTSGRIPPQAGIFVAKNVTDMTDETVTVTKAEMPVERPKWADKTPAQLDRLKRALQEAAELGVHLTVEEPVDAGR